MDLLTQDPRRRPFALSRGYLVIHSAPTALLRHVDWGISNLLGAPMNLEWKPQPLLRGTHRATCEWRHREGLGAQIASALRGWHYLRFELREASEHEQVLYRYTPDLGIHRAVLDQSGSVLISENQIALALTFSEDAMREELAKSVGSAWEMELDPFRRVELEAISQDQAI